MPLDESRFPDLVRDLYRVVAALESMFDRPFTPDGHMVGSLAECIAAYCYALELLPCSTKGCDASFHGRKVEIKATQGTKAVSLRSGPEHLLVLKLFPDGTFEEVYNGPGAPVWEVVETKPPTSNGQHAVSLARLRQLMQDVPENGRIPRMRSFGTPAR